MTNAYMTIWCCECQKYVEAYLTSGIEVYPHINDLKDTPFWKCVVCGNFVGCHHKTKDPTKPLGCIPTPKIKELRKQIHAMMDPLWKSGKIGRRRLYKTISDKLGYEYHTAEIKTTDEALSVCEILRQLTVEE